MKAEFIQRLKKRIRAYFLTSGFTCDGCGEELFDYPAHRLCEKCEEKMIRNDGRTCPKCGRKTIAEGVCLSCKSYAPHFTFGFSPFVYRAETASIVNRVKNGDPSMIAYLGEKMAEYFLSVYPTVSSFKEEESLLVVAVPLTKERRQVRGYNQAEELAKIFSENLAEDGYSIEMDFELLQKTRETGQQKHMDKKNRRENVAGAFHVHKRKACKDRTIVLIDDIMTTGATGNECAARLKGAGAREVLFLTAASLSEQK